MSTPAKVGCRSMQDTIDLTERGGQAGMCWLLVQSLMHVCERHRVVLGLSTHLCCQDQSQSRAPDKRKAIQQLLFQDSQRVQEDGPVGIS